MKQDFYGHNLGSSGPESQYSPLTELERRVQVLRDTTAGCVAQLERVFQRLLGHSLEHLPADDGPARQLRDVNGALAVLGDQLLELEQRVRFLESNITRLADL